MRKALNLDRDGALIQACRDNGDWELRDSIIGAYLPLVRLVARKFRNRGEVDDDLIQEGCIGLIYAFDHYDPKRGVRFRTYAYHCIAGHLLHYFRDRHDLLRIPSWVQEAIAKFAKIETTLSAELGRRPTVAEIAEKANIAERVVRRTLEALRYRDVCSLDDEMTSLDTEGADVQLWREDARLDTAEQACSHVVAEEALSKLKGTEREAVYGSYFLDLTREEAASRLGIPIPHFADVLRSAIERLGTIFAEEEGSRLATA